MRLPSQGSVAFVQKYDMALEDGAFAGNFLLRFYKNNTADHLHLKLLAAKSSGKKAVKNLCS